MDANGEATISKIKPWARLARMDLLSRQARPSPYLDTVWSPARNGGDYMQPSDLAREGGRRDRTCENRKGVVRVVGRVAFVPIQKGEGKVLSRGLLYLP